MKKATAPSINFSWFLCFLMSKILKICKSILKDFNFVRSQNFHTNKSIWRILKLWFLGFISSYKRKKSYYYSHKRTFTDLKEECDSNHNEDNKILEEISNFLHELKASNLNSIRIGVSLSYNCKFKLKIFGFYL